LGKELYLAGKKEKKHHRGRRVSGTIPSDVILALAKKAKVPVGGSPIQKSKGPQTTRPGAKSKPHFLRVWGEGLTCENLAQEGRDWGGKHGKSLFCKGGKQRGVTARDNRIG